MWLLSYSTAKFRDSMSILREASLADETFDLVLYHMSRHIVQLNNNLWLHSPRISAWSSRNPLCICKQVINLNLIGCDASPPKTCLLSIRLIA
jgi:hypothetical protein